MSALSDVVVELPRTSGSRDSDAPSLAYQVAPFSSVKFTRIYHPTGGVLGSGSLLIPANPNRRGLNFIAVGTNSGVLINFTQPDSYNKYGQINVASGFVQQYNHTAYTGPLYYVTTSSTPASGSFVQVAEML